MHVLYYNQIIYLFVSYTMKILLNTAIHLNRILSLSGTFANSGASLNVVTV